MNMGSNRHLINGFDHGSQQLPSSTHHMHRDSSSTNQATAYFSSHPDGNFAQGTSPLQIPQRQTFESTIPQNDPSYIPSDQLPAPCIHRSRCPPLDMEFLWNLYHQRHLVYRLNNTNNDGDQARIQILQSQGFPVGLATMLLQHTFQFPLRIWLVDNSGTMHQDDGHIVTQTKGGKVEMVHCSRWEEVSSALRWHAELAAWLQTPMVVRFLRDPGAQVGPQQVGVSASKHFSSNEEVTRLKALLRGIRPTGATCPIHHHLQELVPGVHALVPKLEAESRRLVISICTDSIPTDMNGMENEQIISDFLFTLRQFMEWPVQVVIRLLTDEERVVAFYQELSRDMTSLQVLDDYVSECKLVQKYNPWLHYGYPLHLCREQGIHRACLEALSQRPLTADESAEALRIIFHQERPQDEISSAHFLQQVKEWNKDAGVLWNPLKKRFVSWVDMKKLSKCYNHDEKCNLM